LIRQCDLSSPHPKAAPAAPRQAQPVQSSVAGGSVRRQRFRSASTARGFLSARPAAAQAVPAASLIAARSEPERESPQQELR